MVNYTEQKTRVCMRVHTIVVTFLVPKKNAKRHRVDNRNRPSRLVIYHNFGSLFVGVSVATVSDTHTQTVATWISVCAHHIFIEH